MQSLKDKQFNDVLYHDVSTPRRLVWEYQTTDCADWRVAESGDLLFRIIPSGKLVAYRLKKDEVAL